jgi:hypothetical protein
MKQRQRKRRYQTLRTTWVKRLAHLGHKPILFVMNRGESRVMAMIRDFLDGVGPLRLPTEP